MGLGHMKMNVLSVKLYLLLGLVISQRGLFLLRANKNIGPKTRRQLYRRRHLQPQGVAAYTQFRLSIVHQHASRPHGGQTTHNTSKENSMAGRQDVATGVRPRRWVEHVEEQMPMLIVPLWETIVEVNAGEAYPRLWKTSAKEVAASGKFHCALQFVV